MKCLYGLIFFIGGMAPTYAALEWLDDFSDLEKNHPEVLQQNLRKVEEITAHRLPFFEEKAIHDSADILRLNRLEIRPSFSYALGHVGDLWPYYRGLNSFITLPGLMTLGTALLTSASNLYLKGHFAYPRPFVLSNKIHPAEGQHYNVHSINAFLSFPSGHTAMGYEVALMLIQFFPERSEQLLTAAADFGHSRIILGVHYPLDIIGSRMAVSSEIASLLSFPWYRRLIATARFTSRLFISRLCHRSIPSCLHQPAQNNPLYAALYQDETENRQRFKRDLSYGFTPVHDSHMPFIAPKESGWLLLFRFPYLTDQQRKEIIASTSEKSGNPLDHRGNKGSWQRINLLEASRGPRHLVRDWQVNMDGTLIEKLISGFFNPYYQQDTWTNPIEGPGRLKKWGQGTLILAANTRLAALEVGRGTLVLLADHHLEQSSQVKKGLLQVEGSFTSSAPLVIEKDGVLSGHGMINAPLFIVGVLMTDSALPFKIRKPVVFAEKSIYRPYRLSAIPALCLQGKTSVTLNGTLDARFTRPGFLLAKEKNGDIQGQFHTILSPFSLTRQGYFYALLKHEQGLNLYIASQFYPKLQGLKSKEKMGSELLLRLQGDEKIRDEPLFAVWLNYALATGDTAFVPLTLALSPLMGLLSEAGKDRIVSFSAWPAYLTGEQEIWQFYGDALYRRLKGEGNWDKATWQRENLQFGYQRRINPHWRLLYALSLAGGRYRVFEDKGKIQEPALILGFSYYPLGDQNGIYGSASAAFGPSYLEQQRLLGFFGRTRSHRTGIKTALAGQIGYRFKKGADALSIALDSQMQTRRFKAMKEEGGILASDFPSITSITWLTGLELNWQHLLSQEQARHGAWVSQVGLRFEKAHTVPSALQAKIHQVSYRFSEEKAHSLSSTLYMNLSWIKSKNRFKLQGAYQVGRTEKAVSASLTFSHHL